MQVIVGKTKAQRQADSKSSVKASKVRCVSLPEEPIPAKDPRATFSEPIQSPTGFVSFLIIVNWHLDARSHHFLDVLTSCNNFIYVFLCLHDIFYGILIYPMQFLHKQKILIFIL